MAHFIYATDIAPRVMFAPAGHFCTACPTVIVDEKLIASGVKDGDRFRAVVGVDYVGKKPPDCFQTWNGHPLAYILDENEQVMDVVIRGPASHGAADGSGFRRWKRCGPEAASQDGAARSQAKQTVRGVSLPVLDLPQPNPPPTGPSGSPPTGGGAAEDWRVVAVRRNDVRRGRTFSLHLRPSGYHFAFFLPFSRHNSRQLAATPGTSRQVGKLLTPLE